MRKFALLVVISLLAYTAQAQYTAHTTPDSIPRYQVTLASSVTPRSVSRDTVLVPEVPDNPLLSSPNYIYKRRLDSIQKRVPLTYNEYVQSYIDLYSNKRKELISKMLGQSKYYFPIFEKALKELGIPEEIKYLTIIESAMDAHAVSRVGATGLWQFMFTTAKDYHLNIDNFVDERKDPIAASYAAAAYFRDAYAELGDWLLAIAAYNCGKGNVTRAINKAGSRDFWEIRRFLPKETRNYVPALIAAIYVMNCYNKHGITPQEASFTANTDSVMVSKFISLADLGTAIGFDAKSLAALNPSYKKHIVNGTVDEPKRIIIPALKKEYYTALYEVLNNSSAPEMRVIAASNDDRRVAHSTKSKPSAYHKVKKGENLNSIADDYNIEVQDIKVWNKLKTTSIVPGQKLIISKASALASSEGKKKAPAAKYFSYKVKAGDTLSEIADKFDGATVKSIQHANGLGKTRIRQGMVLKINKE